jgi:hypothetical protein
MIEHMYEGDLDDLDTADLLTAASEFVDVQERAAVRMLEAALAYADRHAVIDDAPDGGEMLPGTERLKVYGGAGCPGVAEFAPIEFGAVTRMSTGAAASFIGEALALRHRLPRIWAAVLAGNAVPWRARKVAHACLSLSVEAAAIVDRRVVGIVNTVTPSKLATIVKAALWEADPDLAKAHAEAVAKERGVYVGPSDDHGTKRFWVRAAAGDVIRFDATINDIARALKILGDPDSLSARRAKAIGWIADPAAAHQLLEVARYLARTRPHVTTNDDSTDRDTADHSHAAADFRAADDGEAADDARANTAERADTVTRAGATDGAGTDDEAGMGDCASAGHRVDPDRCGAAAAQPAQDDTGDETEATAPDDGPNECAATVGWPVPDDDQVPDDWYGHDAATGPGESGAPAGDVADDPFTRRMLADSLPARLAAIKQHAYRHGLAAGSGQRPTGTPSTCTSPTKHLPPATVCSGSKNSDPCCSTS